MSYNWKYIQPTGPTIFAGWKPATGTVFPYLPDDRSDAEIQQAKFDAWQQQYEFEMQNPLNT